MRKNLTVTSFLLPAFFATSASLSGCGGALRDDAPAPLPVTSNAVDLAVASAPLEAHATQGASCEAIASKRRQALVSRLALDAKRQRDAMLARTSSACAMDDADSGVVYAPSPNAGAGASGPSATTGTNVQVAGVDEADFVKNDGQAFYVLAQGKFQIVDAWPAASAHRVGLLDLTADGEPQKLFIEGSKAYVYLRVAGASSDYGYGGGSSECTYGYECTPTDDGSTARLLTIDFSNRAAPRIERRIDFPGSLLAARKVGSRIHTVLTRRPMGDVPSLGADPWSLCNAGEGVDPAAVYAEYDRAFLAAKARVEAMSSAAIVPVVVDDGVASAAACGSIWVQDGGTEESLLTVASFDAALPHDAVQTSSFLGEPGFVYASADNVYVASTVEGSYGFGSSGASQSRSFVQRFALANDTQATHYEASGEVPGHVINSFAMDEREGVLRIATSVGHLPDPSTHSVLSVLERNGAVLNTVASIGDIAPSEDIRSVRFMGDRAYVVTFKKTDPLWVFDVGDARHPRLLGELQIPGFSTYMHPIDRDHLLTIGFNAADQGEYAWFTSLRLQILDVSNPTVPRLLFAHDIGTRGTSSEAATDHLAFTYFPEKNLLAVPVDVCEGGNQNGGYGDRMTFSGLMVFGVDTSTGFTLKGGVDHRSQDPNATDPGYSGCSTWWANATSRVERSAFFDDFVYSIAPDQMKVQDTRSLGQDLASVRF